MDIQFLEEVLECLRGERTLFTYYRDAYAAYLLQIAIADKDAVALRELKNSRWASLLNRPVIREIVSRCGNGYLRKEQLATIWSENPEIFVLTVGTWGHAKDYRWRQITRPGSNLVLQLNLSNKWHHKFQSLINESANDYFGYCHPLSNTRTMTLTFDELGVKHLYYHTFKSGSVLKNIGNTQPPRSLYSELPEKFCFNETQSAPEFLRKDKRARRKLKKIKDCRWFYMAA